MLRCPKAWLFNPSKYEELAPGLLLAAVVVYQGRGQASAYNGGEGWGHVAWPMLQLQC